MLSNQNALTAPRRGSQFNMTDATCSHRLETKVDKDPRTNKMVEIRRVYVTLIADKGMTEFDIAIFNDTYTVQLPSNVSIFIEFARQGVLLQPLLFLTLVFAVRIQSK